MHVTLLKASTALVSILLGTLVVTPANAKVSRPSVDARSSVVIPWHDCQSTAKWINVIYASGTRIDSSEVVSVRKRGYTFPVSRYRVCGYMGSGTYTVKTKVWWSVSRVGTKRVRVYRERDVDVPFTCGLEKLPDTPTEDDEWNDYAIYRCAYDDGREWDEDAEYSSSPDDLDYFETYFSVNNLPGGWQASLMQGRLDVWPSDPTSDMPPTFTGATRESESYVTYRKKRVLKWIKKPTMTVTRDVRVTVR